MRRHLLIAIPVVTISIFLLLNLGFCDQLPVDDHFDLFGNSDEGYYNEYYFNLTKGDTISINISVTGDPTTFDIANASGFLYGPTPVLSSLQTTWPVPYNDTYTFHFGTGGASAISHVHFEAALVGQIPEYPLSSILVLFMITMLFIEFSKKQKRPNEGQKSLTVNQISGR